MRPLWDRTTTSAKFAGTSNFPYCSEFDELCDECVIEHGPDACNHDPAGDNDRRARCDECGAVAETRFASEITHERDCSKARGVVDPHY